MNPLPPNADELVSAYVDGQAAPNEVATVESSAELMARVEAMRAVSGQIAESVTPPPAQKEAHLAAALGAFDELFAPAEATPTNAAPTPATSTTTTAPVAATATTESPVVSLDAARERKRPRRFNVGIIAAALAAVLLIAGLSVLGGGRSDNTAMSGIEASAVEASSSDAASDTSDSVEDAMDDEEEAMEDEEAMAEVEEAMDDDASGRTSELSDSGSAEAAPAPTAPPPAAVTAQDAVEEDAMADDAMADDEAAAAAEAPAEALAARPFSFGDFGNLGTLETELDSLTREDIDERKADVGQGLFARCQDLIPELAEVATPTLFGDAFVARQPRELHLRFDQDDNAQFYVVNPEDCSVVGIFE